MYGGYGEAGFITVGTNFSLFNILFNSENSRIASSADKSNDSPLASSIFILTTMPICPPAFVAVVSSGLAIAQNILSQNQFEI